jgi:hypothetical protein
LSNDHDSHDVPVQGIFIGWLALGLIVLMAAFTLLVLGSAASQGFH